jgi:hypothetical protein
MNETTPPEPEKTTSKSYLKYLLQYALVFAATLAAGSILWFSVIAFAKQMLGVEIFSPPLIGLIYSAGFVWWLVWLLRRIMRRVKDTEKQISESQRSRYRPTRITLALLAIVPILGLLFYYMPLDPFGFEKQKLENELLKSLDAWGDLKISDYDLDVFIITPLKSCPPSPEVRLSVRQYDLMQVFDLRTNQVIPIGEGQCSYTNFAVHELFMMANDVLKKYDPQKDYLKIEYHPGFGFISNFVFNHCESGRLLRYDLRSCEDTTVFASRLRWDNALTETMGTQPLHTVNPITP